MNESPEIVGRDEFAALIVRTDYADQAAWRAVVADLSRPWGQDGAYEPLLHVVDDPVWAGAASDQVLQVVEQDQNLRVAFIADHVTMRSAHRALLALTLTAEEDEDLDPMYYQELIDSPAPREFRTVPSGVHDIHANLLIGNMDFEEFAEAALADPEGIFRPF